MKVFISSLATCCILFLAGCIPSIHGIVTEDSRVTDDRILGEWKMRDGDLSTVITSGQSGTQESADDELEIWTIERVADITYTLDRGQGVQQSTIIEGARSMVPDLASMVSVQEKDYYFLTEVSIEKGDTLINQIIMQLTDIDGETFVDFKPYEGSDNMEAFSLFYPNVVPAHTFGGIEVENGHLIIKPLNSEFIEELIRTKRIRLKHEVTAREDIVLTASTEDLRTFIGKYAADERLYESFWNFQSIHQ